MHNADLYEQAQQQAHDERIAHLAELHTNERLDRMARLKRAESVREAEDSRRLAIRQAHEDAQWDAHCRRLERMRQLKKEPLPLRSNGSP
jgi:hypothetical protein